MSKAKYYHIHVNHGGGHGYSEWFKATFPKKPSKDTLISHAINNGIIAPDDGDEVDIVNETTKSDYLEATK